MNEQLDKQSHIIVLFHEDKAVGCRPVLLLGYLTCRLSASIAKFGVSGDCAPHFSLFLVTRYFQLRQVSVVKTEYFLIRST